MISIFHYVLVSAITTPCEGPWRATSLPRPVFVLKGFDVAVALLKPSGSQSSDLEFEVHYFPLITLTQEFPSS